MRFLVGNRIPDGTADQEDLKTPTPNLFDEIHIARPRWDLAAKQGA